jgi:GMP synthase-like glutamine amidotransferase
VKKPRKGYFVLDILHDDPPEDGKLGWNNIERPATVYGLKPLEFKHYKELKPADIDAARHAFVVLSPAGSKSLNPDQAKLKAAFDAITSSGLPILGICLGHQWLAKHYGSKVIDGKEWGEYKVRVVKYDPVFKGIPRNPFFICSQSHNFMVDRCPEEAEVLASTKTTTNHVFKYKNKPWYTFQGHFERDWEGSCPDGCIVMKNVLREFGALE